MVVSEDLDAEIWIPLDWTGNLRNRFLITYKWKRKILVMKMLVVDSSKDHLGLRTSWQAPEKVVNNGLLEAVS